MSIKRTMRILIITENDEFYLPLALQAFIETNNYHILGVISAKNPLLKGKFHTAKKFGKIFGLLPVVQKGISLLKAKTFDLFSVLNRTGRFWSIEKVCQHYNLEYSFCENINDSGFVAHLSSLNLDLIACISPTQIFRDQLINTPKYGCINIHTASLPNYRGLYPTYWAMASGEKEVGICIHYIESGIDTGKILLRCAEKIPANTSMDYMLKKTNVTGGELLSQACKLIGEGKIAPEYAQGEGSYYSFPTKESYTVFKSNGYTLW